MKRVGTILLVVGVLVGALALTMKTTVTTESIYIGGQPYGGGQQVYNIGLQADQRNTLLVAGVLVILGGILVVAGKSQGGATTTADPATGERKCPQCAEYIKSEAKVCRFCGYTLPPIVQTEEMVRWRCPDCRTEVRVGDTRCAKCGRKLDFGGALPPSKTGWRCPECRSEVSEGDRRCRKCGRKLDFG